MRVYARLVELQETNHEQSIETTRGARLIHLAGNGRTAPGLQDGEVGFKSTNMLNVFKSHIQIVSGFASESYFNVPVPQKD